MFEKEVFHMTVIDWSQKYFQQFHALEQVCGTAINIMTLQSMFSKRPAAPKKEQNFPKILRLSFCELHYTPAPFTPEPCISMVAIENYKSLYFRNDLEKLLHSPNSQLHLI